jgi:hypothetical protein
MFSLLRALLRLGFSAMMSEAPSLQMVAPSSHISHPLSSLPLAAFPPPQLLSSRAVAVCITGVLRVRC